MATLASVIAEKLRVLVAAKTLVELSKFRQPGAVGEDTSVTDAAAEMAAADVHASLGEDDEGVDGSDTRAVHLGVRLAIRNLATTYTAMPTPEGQQFMDGVVTDLERERKRRLAGNSGPQASTPSGSFGTVGGIDLDTLFGNA